jgi:uncharacterized protein YjiK
MKIEQYKNKWLIELFAVINGPVVRFIALSKRGKSVDRLSLNFLNNNSTLNYT